MTPTACFIVTKDQHGNDRMFAGCQNGQHTWTMQAEKARKFTTGLALELLRDFERGARIVVGHRTLGPKVIHGADHKFYILGYVG